MIDMTKVQPNQGYANKMGLPTATAATGTKANVKTGAGSVGYQAPAPGGYQEPDAGLVTPSGWQDVEDFASAGMRSPYQRSEGIDRGYSGIDDLFANNGYQQSATGWNRANDALFARQLEEEKQRLRQQFTASGYGNSSVLGSGMMRGISDMYLNRELAAQGKDLELGEAGRSRLMKGLEMLPGMASVENQGLQDWRTAGQGYAGLRNTVANQRWLAPGQLAGWLGGAGTGYNAAGMTPEMAALNQQLTPAAAEVQRNQPTLGQQIGGAISNSMPAIEDIYKAYGGKNW